MESMKKSILIGLLSLITAGLAVAAPAPYITSSTSTIVSTEPTHGNGQCTDKPDAPCSSEPTWRQQLEQAKSSWGACEEDVNRFCEGVQVGEGRIEACLKEHHAKLSKACRTSQQIK